MRMVKKCLVLMLILMAMLTVSALAEDWWSTPTDVECGHSADALVLERDVTGHWWVCGECGKIVKRDLHVELCNSKVCITCGWPNDESADEDYNYHWSWGHYNSAVSVIADKEMDGLHLLHCANCGYIFADDYCTSDGKVYSDADSHWLVCKECGDKYGAEAHKVVDGTCSECGYVLYTPAPTATPAATATPVPTEAATDTAAPTEAPTTAPTQQAQSGGNNEAAAVTAEPTATPRPALDGESFLSRFQGNSELAADGGLLSGAVNETVTLVMEATGEENYDGSELTIFAAGSRGDGVLIDLSSKYEPEAIQNFMAWQESIQNVEALEATEAYHGFVELAEALVQTLLPEKTADEVGAIIVAILQSSFDGTLENSNLASAYFGDDIDGDIVGYLAEDGYEFFLVLRDEEIELLVRELD